LAEYFFGIHVVPLGDEYVLSSSSSTFNASSTRTDSLPCEAKSSQDSIHSYFLKDIRSDFLNYFFASMIAPIICSQGVRTSAVWGRLQALLHLFCTADTTNTGRSLCERLYTEEFAVTQRNVGRVRAGHFASVLQAKIQW
jgi:hypothetical protein